MLGILPPYMPAMGPCRRSQLATRGHSGCSMQVRLLAKTRQTRLDLKQTNQLSYMAQVKQTLTNAAPDETAQEEEHSTDIWHAESTEML